MGLKRIALSDDDYVFVKQNDGDLGCGEINEDGHLYLINESKKEAFMLPDEYKDTPIVLWHPCGGYADGLIMVSLLGDIDLQYHHDFYDTAGMWGWIDTDGNVVIEPQYVFAMMMFDGKAVVCKGDWTVDDKGRYWCDNEQWGIIDKKGTEVIPFLFNEITEVDNSENYYLCHSGDWQDDSHYSVWNADTREKEFDLDFNFDNVYMFNECYKSDDKIVFFEHDVNESKNYIYVYSLSEKKWIAHKELVAETERETVTIKDGTEITLY